MLLHRYSPETKVRAQELMKDLHCTGMARERADQLVSWTVCKLSIGMCHYTTRIGMAVVYSGRSQEA